MDDKEQLLYLSMSVNVSSLERKLSQKRQQIFELANEFEDHKEVVVFMSGVAIVSVILMFMHAVWC